MSYNKSVMEDKFTNRLIKEISPYLLQHAHNPVEWYPWGAEALERAKMEDKPILLSVGYSACHWCHVMEKESFDNEETASIMNEHFINIKVDREERPDLDHIYQSAIHILGIPGGWPLTLFLTPDGEPFFGGTYFPPEDRAGFIGFRRVLLAVSQAYKTRYEDAWATAREIRLALSRLSSTTLYNDTLEERTLEEAASKLLRLYDPSCGGFGTAPKFPSTMVLSFLLNQYHRTGETYTLQALTHTLTRMAEGGIYDQLGGGFHRYSVDARWLIPHFEKMLYDNALLIRLYLEAYQVTHDPLFRRTAEEAISYITREMLSPEGGFYTSQDADSEGIEGKYYVWDKGEAIELLGKEYGEILCRYFGMTEEGNLHGKNVLYIDRTVKALASEFQQSEEDLERIIKDAKQRLFLERYKRVRPGLDTKIITAWNGLMISAVTSAYKIIGDSSCLRIAEGATEFILRNIKDDRLFHVYKNGRSRPEAYLDDYAFFIGALIDLYEATLKQGYLERAKALTEGMVELFLDREGGGFYYTAPGQEGLINRPKTGHDDSVPSGNTYAFLDLLRLSYYLDREDFKLMAEQVIRLYYKGMIENPFGFSTMLRALYFYLDGPTEIVITGNGETERTMGLLSVIYNTYLPNSVIYLVDHKREQVIVPLFARGKTEINGISTVYVCRRSTCYRPTTDKEELRTLLQSLGRA